MPRFIALLGLALWALTLTSTAGATNPRTVLSKHDPEDRLPNTAIRDLGSVSAQGATYSIYYLTFVSPVSHHGQHRIAIISNGNEFVGAYQCWLEEGGARLAIGKDRMTAYAGGQTFVIKFDSQGPLDKTSAFCGEGSGWENSI